MDLGAHSHDFIEGLIYLFGDEELRGLKRLSKKLDIIRYYVRLSMDMKVGRIDEIGEGQSPVTNPMFDDCPQTSHCITAFARISSLTM